ncbi:polysaccharide deacetylase family protein [Aspergillus clavatus NRRL 1]|uniref:Polysaccharide deacetylase, putative n=1 Tax=Aspergillus clavatus (strain ATCC 1007 / CBS 513.65 / DSM 816 / NCTC 3887 / NRRL 1 / QM 1276 / 107) TaxID=344612 RepID=A1CAE9_ASPCL|nr:polysaccharide deacetylase, putative [Aspergillus clavatus NRRL 1]EAW12717.1 polysaccharide deacetylase, putative [Aspergillus clavatus NRRL 1]
MSMQSPAEDSSNDISRGIWAAAVGTRRLLKFFNKYGIKATWFVPGHSLESFTEDMAAVRDAGHEIGLHGYSHENPKDMTVEQQRDVLDKTYRVLTEFAGKPPRGGVAPCCSWATASSMTTAWSHEDCQAYYLWTGDTWTNIDHTKTAKEWMKPLVQGQKTGLGEIPANWYIDDLPPMMCIKAAPNSHGFVNPRDVEDI